MVVRRLVVYFTALILTVLLIPIEGLSQPETAPPTIRAEAGNGAVLLTIEYSGPKSVQQFRIYREPKGGRFTPSHLVLPKSGAKSTTHVDESIDNDVTYTYRAQVRPKDGPVSPRSEPVSATPSSSEDRPPAPKGLSADVQDGNVQLSWQEVKGDIHQYLVYRRSGGEENTFDRQIGTPLSNTTDRRVQTGKSYTYRVTAVDESANESRPSITRTVSIGDGGPCDEGATSVTPPSALRANAVAGSVTLTWNPSRDGDRTAIYRGTSSNPEEMSQIATVPSPRPGVRPGPSYEDTEVQGRSRYFYRLQAVSDGQKSECTEAESAEVNAALAPQNLRASGGAGSVQLSWQPPTNSDPIEGYAIYRSRTDDFDKAERISTVELPTTEYSDDNLVGRETWKYWVTSVYLFDSSPLKDSAPTGPVRARPGPITTPYPGIPPFYVAVPAIVETVVTVGITVSISLVPKYLGSNWFTEEGKYELYKEKAALPLKAPLDVDVREPGEVNREEDLKPGRIPGDTQVNSYLLHSNNNGSLEKPRIGELEFSNDILGLIVDGRRLAATDDLLGGGNTEYDLNSDQRGFEVGEDGKSLRLGNDRRTLEVRLRRGGDVNQIRILTRSDAFDEGRPIEEQPPGAPENLQAKVRDGNVIITGQMSLGGPIEIDQYRLYRSTSPDMSADEEPLKTVSGSAGEFRIVDERAEAGTEYYYSVAAVSDEGVQGFLSSPVNVGLEQMVVPKQVEAESQDENVRLTWQGFYYLSDDAVRIYRRNVDQDQFSLVAEEPTEFTTIQSYIDKSVVVGQEYVYRLAVVDDEVEGPLSDSARVEVNEEDGGEPGVAPPDNFVASPGDQNVRLCWDPANERKSEVNQYLVYSLGNRDEPPEQLPPPTDTIPADDYDHQMSGIENETGHLFGVAARTSSGSIGPISTARATPQSTNISEGLRRLSSSAGRVSDLDVGQINGDDLADIAYTTLTDEVIWQSTDESKFGERSRTFSETSQEPRVIALEDADDDSDLDIITGFWNSRRIVIQEHRDNISEPNGPVFSDDWNQHVVSRAGESPEASEPPHPRPRDIHAADVDADGDTEILVAWAKDRFFHSDEEDPIFLYERSNGNFSGEPIAQLEQPTSVQTADVDSDGYLDVVAASAESNRVVWIKQFRQGGYTSPIEIAEVEQPSEIAATDLDGDGDRDLIVGSWAEDKVMWYRHTGDGFKKQEEITDSQVAPMSIDTGDMDGDGDPDIVVTSKMDHTMAWYEVDNPGTQGECPPSATR